MNQSNLPENSDLPEKWCVKTNKENYKIIYEWLDKNSQNGTRYKGYININVYVHYPHDLFTHVFQNIRKGYTEITFEQFQQHFLNKTTMKEQFPKDDFGVIVQDNAKEILEFLESKGFDKSGNKGNAANSDFYYVKPNETDVFCSAINPTSKTYTLEQLKNLDDTKQIIGYKLIKPQYANSAALICGYGLGALNSGNIKLSMVPKLEEAGVLNLWFEPVYEETFKVGDWVIGWHSDKYQYYNKPWKIGKIDGDSVCPVKTYFPDQIELSVHKKHIRKATNDELKQVQIELPTINGYKGKYENGLIIYGCAKFNVKALKALHSFNTLQNGVSDRKLQLFKLNSDVEITIDQLNQIINYLKDNHDI